MRFQSQTNAHVKTNIAKIQPHNTSISFHAGSVNPLDPVVRKSNLVVNIIALLSKR